MGGGSKLNTPVYPWWEYAPMHFHLPGFDGSSRRYLQWFQGIDWPSVRRGRQIYTEVFAPCHSLQYMCFRHLTEFMTVEEVKALAAEYDCIPWDAVECRDETDEEGNTFTRPGKPVDKIPLPYKNEAAAKFSNGGAAPPDLTLMVRARWKGESYIMSLLTAYHRPLPAGVAPARDGLFWNPYFDGGFLAMPPPLSEGMVDFDDGTPASVSQMAKDTVCFLHWTAMPFADERKYHSMKTGLSGFILYPFMYYWYKTRFNVAKNIRHKVHRIGYL